MFHRRFVIPDIHGCARTFAALLYDVLRIRQDDSVYLLGDVVDRGPRSKDVIDLITALRKDGLALYLLRGNHEEMLLRSCGSLDYYRVWLLNGGKATLKSFSVDDPCDIPASYRKFCSSLPYYLELEDCILVHAGLNCKAPDPYSDTEFMLWSRSCDEPPECGGHKKVISGHTPVSREQIKHSIMTNRIQLDNGCVYSSDPHFGTLAALELNNMSLYFQKNID